jgi:hypothetical protein
VRERWGQVTPRPVELADGNALAVTAETYTEYPLIIFSQDGKKEIAWVTADENGNYRVELPPGDYVLDVQGRARPRARETAAIHGCLESDCPRRYGY